MPTSTPILGAARGAHGEQHDLQVGGAVAIAPLGSARPTKHVLLHLKGCAAAHATRAAHLTSSSPAPSGAPVRTRHRTTRAASHDPKPFARWSVSVRIGTDWRMWPMPSPSAPAQGCDLRRTSRRSAPQPAMCGVVRAWARPGGGALFMDDVRPPKNSPRTSNVSTCCVSLSVTLFLVFCGVRFEIHPVNKPHSNILDPQGPSRVNPRAQEARGSIE